MTFQNSTSLLGPSVCTQEASGDIFPFNLSHVEMERKHASKLLQPMGMSASQAGRDIKSAPIVWLALGLALKRVCVLVAAIHFQRAQAEHGERS